MNKKTRTGGTEGIGFDDVCAGTYVFGMNLLDEIVSCSLFEEWENIVKHLPL